MPGVFYFSKVDLGEILSEHKDCRFPDRLYNLKIGIPWADLERRLDVQAVLSLRDIKPFPSHELGVHSMGVDTGKELHVVVLFRSLYRRRPLQVVHLEAVREFRDLDRIMRQFGIDRCVIDGLPETHATRDFARWYGHDKVYLCFFSENQHGTPKWDRNEYEVEVNRPCSSQPGRVAFGSPPPKDRGAHRSLVMRAARRGTGLRL